jgi:hypothetical protein
MKKILLYAIIVCIIHACSDEITVNQKYSFELQTLPVPKRIKQDETVEIRCQIVKEGNYAGAAYSIRYFQPDGKGELCLDDGRQLTPNDLFQLEKETFRMYYTSRCTDQQVIDVYIEDNFKQVAKISFSFTNETEKKEE